MFKRIFLFAAIAGFAFGLINSRKKKSIPLIGDKAPSFFAKSTQGLICFPDDYKGNWVIFFSHPADFTPVCTTEFMLFESMKKDFEKLNTKLLGLSVDSLNSHFAWLKDIKENIEKNDYSEFDTAFPLIEDANRSIAKKYGMIQPNADNTKTVRAVFIIDPDGIVRAILYYPQTNGRNIEEIKRLLIALQTTDKFSVVTPANWEAGDEVIITPPSTKQEAIERLKNMDDTKCYDWFLCFKSLPRDVLNEKLLNHEENICN